MAFNKDRFGVWSVSMTNLGTQLFSYNSADTLAVTVTDGYFNDVNSGNPDKTLSVNDLVYVQATDGRGFYFVDAVTPNIGITVLP